MGEILPRSSSKENFGYNPEQKNKLEIRNPLEGDLEHIKNILREGVLDNDGNPNDQEIEFYLQEIENSIRRKNERKYIIAVDQNASPVGIIGYMPVSMNIPEHLRMESTVELVNLYVASATRNQGIGSFLLQGVEEIIKDGGFNNIVFLSSRRHEDAWRLYDRQRYAKVEDGTSPFGYPCAFFYKKVD